MTLRELTESDELISRALVAPPAVHEPDLCIFAGLAIEMESASQIICDIEMNDVQAQSRAATIPTCREDRIEGFALTSTIMLQPSAAKRDQRAL
jgi:hypothetical protein